LIEWLAARRLIANSVQCQTCSHALPRSNLHWLTKLLWLLRMEMHYLYIQTDCQIRFIFPT